MYKLDVLIVGLQLYNTGYKDNFRLPFLPSGGTVMFQMLTDS